MQDFSRRQFMIAATAAAGAAWIGGCATNPVRTNYAGEVQSSVDRFSGFKMGLQSYSLRNFSLEETVQHVADLDLHWVEFYPGQFDVTDDRSRIAEVKAMLAPHYIRMHAHGVHEFTGDEAHNRAIFEFARLAGIELLTAHPTADSFPILHDLVQEYDIKIGIHNHGPGYDYDYVEDSLEAVANWDRRVGFAPDTGHYMRSGEDPVRAIRLLGDRLHGMHLKDQAGVHRDEPPETILGEGVTDLQALCTAMREVGFTGPISLEYELNPDNPIDDIRQGLDNFAAAARATA